MKYNRKNLWTCGCIALILLAFITACATTGPGKLMIPPQQESKVGEPESPAGKTASSVSDYKTAVRRLSVDLAEEVDQRLKVVAQREGPRSVIMTLSAEKLGVNNRWNSFLDRLQRDLDQELANLNIKSMYSDWEFADQIGWDSFASRSCPENFDLPELNIHFEVVHYRSDKDLRVVAEARRLNSRYRIAGFPTSRSLESDVYPWALDAMADAQNRIGFPGSLETPYESDQEVGAFFSRILKCKYKKATEIWQETRPGEIPVDFKLLEYRFLGLRPGPGVDLEIVEAIQRAIDRELQNKSGLKIIGSQEDVREIVQVMDRIEQDRELYLRDEESLPEIRLPISKGLIMGDVHLESRNKLIVSLRTLVGYNLSGEQAMGFGVPELGASCYLWYEPPLQIFYRGLKHRRFDKIGIRRVPGNNALSLFSRKNGIRYFHFYILRPVRPERLQIEEVASPLEFQVSQPEGSWIVLSIDKEASEEENPADISNYDDLLNYIDGHRGIEVGIFRKE